MSSAATGKEWNRAGRSRPSHPANSMASAASSMRLLSYSLPVGAREISAAHRAIFSVACGRTRRSGRHR
jgi:hypothetical protein